MPQSVRGLVDVAPLVTGRVAELVAVGRGEVVEDCGASGAWDEVLVSVLHLFFVHE